MRAWAGVVAALLLGCEPPGPPLQYGPCDPSRVAHVEAFGYWSSASHVEETAAYSTVVWGSPNDVPSAAAHGLRAVVTLLKTFRIADPARPDDTVVERAWHEVAEQLRPHLPVITALYPSDEPYWNGSRSGVPMQEVARRLEHAARVIRDAEGFETVPLAVIFSNPELDWIAAGAARKPAG
jgi:hypothetical protein